MALSRTVVTCEDLELPCYPDSKICVQSEDTLMKNHDSEAFLFITLAGFFYIENTMEGGVPVNCCVVIVTNIHHLG